MSYRTERFMSACLVSLHMQDINEQDFDDLNFHTK